MVRTYQRKYTNARKGKNYAPYQSYSKENLDNAIKAVREGTMKVTDAAKTYNVPKSTLSRKYRNINCTQEKPGHPTLFSPEEEKCFIQNTIAVSEWGFPFDHYDLRVYAQKYLNKIGKTIYGLENNMPGPDWARNFLERHKSEITNRKASNISTDRAKITPEVIDTFFTNYVESVQGVTPDCIINYDETNLTDDPGSKSYIYKRGCKYPERVSNSSKSAISLMFTGTADGRSLPIYVVYKADHLWDQWLEGGPEGTRFNRSKSGWFDSVCFEDWFNTVIVPYAQKKPGKKVLVGDNLSSHFSESVLKTCNELNIAFVCLPPKTTHLLQPLDVAFFAPLKHYWRGVLTEWKLREGRKHKTLVKSSFPTLLNKLKNKLIEKDAESQNLIAGFNKSGLYPIDPDRPKSRLPPQMIITHEQLNSASTSAITEMLHDLRSPLVLAESRRKKKCNVPPGKSITAADLVRNEVQGTKQSKMNLKRKKTLKTVLGKKREKRSLVNSALSSSDEDISSIDSDATRVMENENANMTSDLDDHARISPIPGPSGMCKKMSTVQKCFSGNDSDVTFVQSDHSEEEIVPETTKKPELYKGKGKGVGKKTQRSKIAGSNSKLTKKNMQIDLSEEKTAMDVVDDSSIKQKETTKKPEFNISKGKEVAKKSQPKKQINSKTSDAKELDSHILNSLCTDTTIAKFINKKWRRKYSSDSDTTSVSDSDKMSKHSDSDIFDFIDNSDNSSTRDLTERQEKYVYYDDGLDDKLNEDINSQNNLSISHHDENDLPDLNIEELTLDKYEDQQNFGPFYSINDDVLVRYYTRNKWSYYVGFIETINHQDSGHYTYNIKFYKTVKNPQLAFRRTKKIDRDVVPELSIIKKISLIEIPGNPNELLPIDESDLVYF